MIVLETTLLATPQVVDQYAFFASISFDNSPSVVWADCVRKKKPKNSNRNVFILGLSEKLGDQF